MSKVFSEVGGAPVVKSYFPLNEEYKSCFDGGQLIPTYLRLLNPGDVYKIKDTVVARLNSPLEAPMMSEWNLHTSYFAVPLRILFGEMKDTIGAGQTNNNSYWDPDDKLLEIFLTGGRNGKDNSVSLPRWRPQGVDVVNDNGVTVKNNGIGSLWDYLGFPTGVKFGLTSRYAPLDFPKRAYNLIYNEYFRNPNLGTYIPVDTNEKVMNCLWKMDYFTSMLPFQQRGDESIVPLSGSFDIGSIISSGTGSVSGSLYAENDNDDLYLTDMDASTTYRVGSQNEVSDNSQILVQGSASVTVTNTNAPILSSSIKVSDFRTAIQVQKVLERSMRGGYRYKDYLQANYRTHPTDERLQRPEYLGGYSNPLVVSEVQNNSYAENEPVGKLAGKGLVAGINSAITYHAKEFCILMGITYIKPKADYQQGVDPQWLINSKWDFMNSAFGHLSEQPVRQVTLFAQDTDGDDDNTGNAKILGYQAIYNEYRSSHNRITGALRSTYSYWHSGRIFESAPVLNEAFLKCIPTKRNFVDQSAPSFVVTIGHQVDSWQGIPVEGTPGFVDHN